MKRNFARVVLLIWVACIVAANALYSPWTAATAQCLGWPTACQEQEAHFPYSVPVWSFTVANSALVLGLVALSVVLAVIGFYSARATRDARVAVFARYLEFLPLLTLSVLGGVALFLYPPLH